MEVEYNICVNVLSTTASVLVLFLSVPSSVADGLGAGFGQFKLGFQPTILLQWWFMEFR